MKIQRAGPVPPGNEGALTKGNRELVARARPETGGEETSRVHDDDHDGGGKNAALGNHDEQQLLGSLRELVDRVGPVKAAEALGVTYRTVARAIETNTLTRRMEDALKLRRFEAEGAVAEPMTRRLDALERRQEELEAGLLMLAREVGAQSAKVAGDSGELRDELPARDPEGEPGGPGEQRRDATLAAAGTPPAVIGRPRRVMRFPLGHPEVVTVEPMPEEEFDYAEAAPLVVEWRRARAAFLSHGSSRVERARGGVRMCELGIILIGDHELTLPPSTYRWDEPRRQDELLRAKVSLIGARWELAHALLWRGVRLVLTLGRWRS